MNQKLKKTLENIGLSDKETSVYLSLLELGLAVPSVIARKAGIKRPTVYVVLEQLQQKGLVSHHKNGKMLFYRSLDPSLLLEDQYNKYLSVKSIMSDLNALNSKYTVTPQMTIYQGREGLIKMMEDTLNAQTELYCWADVTLAVETILSDYFPIYLAKKIKRKLRLKGIFGYDKKALRHKKFSEKELREVYLIPKDKYPFKNEINIYDDKVAIISHADSLGVIIQNKNIADTQRAIFEFAFEYAKILEKELLTIEDIAYLNS